MRIYMQTLHSPEQPLRFYHLHLQPDLLDGWNLVRESGLQGSILELMKTLYVVYTRSVYQSSSRLYKLPNMSFRRSYLFGTQ